MDFTAFTSHFFRSLSTFVGILFQKQEIRRYFQGENSVQTNLDFLSPRFNFVKRNRLLTFTRIIWFPWFGSGSLAKRSLLGNELENGNTFEFLCLITICTSKARDTVHIYIYIHKFNASLCSVFLTICRV